MYVGHFGAALALKARYAQTPTWGLLLGAGLLDVLFGPFVLLGWERVTITPGAAPGFALNYIDWSHSLLMALVWAILYGILFIGRGRPTAILMGIAAFSHFVLDLFMHPADLALWPALSTDFRSA